MPWPGGLCTSMRPPIATASSWLIARPRPLPPWRCAVRRPSACSKRWNSRASCPALHARTGVADSSSISRWASSALRNATSPRLGELDRVAAQVEQDLSHPAGIAAQCRVAFRARVAAENGSPLAAPRLEQVATSSSKACRSKRLVERRVSGFDARQVERIVDQSQQVFAGALDRNRPASVAAAPAMPPWSNSAMPSTPVIGVRISCPSVARKRVFASEPWSQSCRWCSRR